MTPIPQQGGRSQTARKNLEIGAQAVKRQHLLCLSSGSASSEGGESFRETSLTSSAVVKCDGLAFGAFPGCITRCFTLTSRFLPPRPAKVTIYATQYRRFLCFFLLFRVHKESWICEATKDRSSASSRNREKKEHLWAALGGAFESDVLRRMHILN